MPSWLLSLIMQLGVPALKAILRAILIGLEKKYPGLTELCDAILKYLESGGSMETLKAHVEPFCSGAGCPIELKEPFNE